jgi:hypothetical protein
MSRHELKPGDRVRVKAESTPHGLKAGARGTVLRLIPSSVSGEPVYVVEMDKYNGFGLEFYFLLADEIEPDG